VRFRNMVKGPHCPFAAALWKTLVVGRVRNDKAEENQMAENGTGWSGLYVAEFVSSSWAHLDLEI
jgi:hypothetical protein